MSRFFIYEFIYNIREYFKSRVSVSKPMKQNRWVDSRDSSYETIYHCNGRSSWWFHGWQLIRTKATNYHRRAMIDGEGHKNNTPLPSNDTMFWYNNKYKILNMICTNIFGILKKNTNDWIFKRKCIYITSKVLISINCRRPLLGFEYFKNVGNTRLYITLNP